MTDIKTKIAQILGIELSDFWDILDSDEDHQLYLIHYTPGANVTKFGDLRGVVVDLEAKTVVCRSFGYTPTAVKDELKLSPDQKLHVTDLLGEEHIIDPNQLRIKIGFEGTIMRVFKHRGQVYHSTHRRLKTERSRWGNSIPFEEMYYVLNGPSDDELFNPQSDYSPYCHIFLMVHPDVLNVTKDDVQQGYLVYLGPKQLWSVEGNISPYKQTDPEGHPIGESWDQDPRPSAGWIDSTLYLPETQTERILTPMNLDLPAANQHLRYGFYDSFPDEQLDPRLRTGEFVILYKLDENQQITGLLKVESTAYRWRMDMRDSNPNLLHRFYQLLNGSYIRTETAEGLAEYRRRFPILTRYSVESIKQHVPFIIWPQETMTPEQENALIQSKDDRLYNIWLGYLMAVPLHRQCAVAEMYDHLITNRANVIDWLQNLEEINNVGQLDIPDRAKKIITQARDMAQRKLEQNVSGRRLDVREMTRNNIRNLIYREEGSSLYRLVKAMNEEEESQLCPA